MLSRRTDIPAAPIQLRTSSLTRRMETEAKGRVNRSGSSLIAPSSSHQAMTEAAAVSASGSTLTRQLQSSIRASLGAVPAVQPRQALLGGAQRAVFEADRTRVAEGVQLREEGFDRLLPGAWLVPSRDVRDLDVADYREVAAQDLGRGRTRHGHVGLGELGAHRQAGGGLDPRPGLIGRGGPGARGG